jgi:D-alanine-D-alanine ligase
MASKKTPTPSSEPRTFGPVADLERHLPSDWWSKLFNSVYLKTDGDVFENDQNTVNEVDTIIRITGLQPNDRILDVCCGQGRHVMEFARRGFPSVEGLDRSRYLIRLARQRARKRNLNVIFHEGDARRFRLKESAFHCVTIMGNSFGYFESSEDDRMVLEACRKALAPGGTIVLDMPDGDWLRTNFEPRTWEWIDQNHFVCRERSLASDGERLISREVITHAERGVIIDQFYAERLYNREAIRALLDSAGFEAVRVHGEMEAASDRGQDVGMMSRRLLLTASCSKTPRVSKAKGIAFPRVMVLMGDPRLPDKVKRDGKFNPEDFETINRLQRALSELPGYEFRYVNNHASFVSQLRSEPPQFVMNLCDEGFNNDAFLELHVPAYLDMLGIPYTGAGPTCLGVCYNKALVRALAGTLDIPVPLETFFSPADQAATLPATFPVLVKPNFGDSSVGITKEAVIQSPDHFMEYLSSIKEDLPGRALLVQEFLTGPEYSVTVIGNPGLTVQFLPVLQVDYSGLPAGLPHILGYESKWLPESPYWSNIRYLEADLADNVARTLQDQSLLLFERLGCQDYARFDFRADSGGEIKLLEANPNPGWCWDGKMNYMAGISGMRYSDLLGLILYVAQERVVAAMGNGGPAGPHAEGASSAGAADRPAPSKTALATTTPKGAAQHASGAGKPKST